MWVLSSGSTIAAGETVQRVEAGKGDLTTDAWGVQKMSLPASVFHGLWTFDISPKMWFTYENGTQTYSPTNIVSNGGQALLSVDATTTDVRLESRETPRYQPNRGHLYSDAGLIVGDKANGTVEHGLIMFNPQTNAIENGVFFRHKPDGETYAVIVSGGTQRVEELIDLSSVSGFDPTFDTEFGQIYDIQHQWRSEGNYHFYIGNPATGLITLVKSVWFLGTLTGASIENPANPSTCRVLRGSGDIAWRWGCADISSENGLKHNREEYASCYTKSYSGSGADFPAIVIRQPELINTKPNTRTVTLARISFSATKRTYFEVWLTRDPTAITGATFRPLRNSFIECDSTDMDATAARATSVDPAKLGFITFVRVDANTRTSVDNPYRDRIEFPLVRGDYLVVTCNDQTASADVVIELGEQV